MGRRIMGLHEGVFERQFLNQFFCSGCAKSSDTRINSPLTVLPRLKRHLFYIDGRHTCTIIEQNENTQDTSQMQFYCGVVLCRTLICTTWNKTMMFRIKTQSLDLYAPFLGRTIK